ncbi:MAG: hypothetical protein ACQKBT_01355 [Puniceicoccales bacterium]
MKTLERKSNEKPENTMKNRNLDTRLFIAPRVLMRSFALVCLASAILPSAGALRADTLDAYGTGGYITASSAGDGNSATNVSVVAPVGTARVGRSSDGINAVTLFCFQLPELEDDEYFSATSLTFRVSSSNGAPINANTDLYAIYGEENSTVLSDYYYIGASDTTDATLIQNDIIESGIVASGDYTTDSAGSTILGDYLNSLYEDGDPAGDYIFLRLSLDSFPSPTNGRYTPLTGNTGTTGGKPYLTYTLSTIPEPAEAGLLIGILALGCIGLVRNRNRR